jgi:hypothetical protein
VPDEGPKMLVLPPFSLTQAVRNPQKTITSAMRAH